jgi:hypothetical protein
MPATYTLISSNVLTSSAASVTFSAIPATYTDLVLRISSRSDLADGAVNVYTTFNSINSGYSSTFIRGDGSSASSGRESARTRWEQLNWTIGTNFGSNIFASFEIYIPSYLSSTNKPIGVFGVLEDNTATVSRGVQASAGLLSNTATVSSITMQPYSGNFVSGSSFYLYGISNA